MDGNERSLLHGWMHGDQDCIPSHLIPSDLKPHISHGTRESVTWRTVVGTLSCGLVRLHDGLMLYTSMFVRHAHRAHLSLQLAPSLLALALRLPPPPPLLALASLADKPFPSSDSVLPPPRPLFQSCHNEPSPLPDHTTPVVNYGQSKQPRIKYQERVREKQRLTR
jgi:hypothetical protein